MNTRFKYPRTPHLPWSQGVSDDDVRCIDTNMFQGKQVVVTEKMDGENTSLYCDYYHARSIDSRHHPSRDWIKRFHAEIAQDIPTGWRICGENLYARHSIAYDTLRSYFYGFSIWNERNECLSWADSQVWFDMLGIEMPTLLYQGKWDEPRIRSLLLNTDHVEGYVVRLADAFAYSAFAHSVAKWVRADHVQTEQHWMKRIVVANQLQQQGGDS